LSRALLNSPNRTPVVFVSRLHLWPQLFPFRFFRLLHLPRVWYLMFQSQFPKCHFFWSPPSAFGWGVLLFWHFFLLIFPRPSTNHSILSTPQRHFTHSFRVFPVLSSPSSPSCRFFWVIDNSLIFLLPLCSFSQSIFRSVARLATPLTLFCYPPPSFLGPPSISRTRPPAPHPTSLFFPEPFSDFSHLPGSGPLPPSS